MRIVLKTFRFWCGEVKTETFENADIKMRPVPTVPLQIATSIQDGGWSYDASSQVLVVFIVFERFSESETKTLAWMKIFCFVSAQIKTETLKSHHCGWSLREVHQTPTGNYVITSTTVRHRKRKIHYS